MKVVIVGAGASGIVAAIEAAKNKNKVYLLEKNDRIGKKILATGNGRCNLSNLNLSTNNYHGDSEFVNKILSAYSVQDTIDFFEDIGLNIKEKNGYLYPYCEQASAVLEVLRYELSRYDDFITIMNECTVSDIKKTGNLFEVFTSKGKISTDKVIITTGSKAAAKTGSDGSGYTLAKRLGHRVVKPLPALTSLKSEDFFIKQLAGVRTEGRVYIESDGKLLDSEYGEIQFNKEGISGIPVFQLAGIAAREMDKGRNIRIKVDFIPFIDKELTEQYISDRIKRFALRPSSELMIGVLNKNISQVLAKRAGISFDDKCGTISEKQLKKYIRLLKEFDVNILGVNDFENAQTCVGGVDTNQIKGTLESRLVDGLYFAGEVLDVTGDCGGYNLQWAWSSGNISGRLL